MGGEVSCRPTPLRPQDLSRPLPLPVTCPVLEAVGSAVLALGPKCLLAA